LNEGAIVGQLSFVLNTDNQQVVTVGPVSPVNDNTLTGSSHLEERRQEECNGLAPCDSRPIGWVLTRRTIVNGGHPGLCDDAMMDAPADDTTVPFDFHEHLLNDGFFGVWQETMITSLKGSLDKSLELTPADEAAIRKLTITQARQIQSHMQTGNGLVVDFNPMASAALRCNTAMLFLGSCYCWAIASGFLLSNQIYD
jgi:hypothetical protein